MSNWKPQESYAIRLSDETADNRTDEQLDEMVEKIRDVANEYGFDLQTWGGWKGMQILAVNEKMNIIKDKIFEELNNER